MSAPTAPLANDGEEDPLQDWREWDAEMKDKEAKILLEPRVSEWISQLVSAGADREAVLRSLAISASWQTAAKVNEMREKQKRLLALRKNVKKVADMFQELDGDIMGLPACWIAIAKGDWDAPVFRERHKTPSVIADELLGIARALAVDVRTFDRLIKYERERAQVNPTLALMALLRRQTGAFHDRLLADLLAAAHQALGSSDSFTEEQLNKLRQRKGPGLISAKRTDPRRGQKGKEI